MMEYKAEDICFKHPFSALVAGPSSSGKTVFVRRLLSHAHELTTLNVPARVIWAYGQWQELYNEPLPFEISYVRGLPSEQEVRDSKANIIVIDDLMGDLSSDRRLSSLFTRGSHHWQVSVIFIVQNLFHQGRQMRDVHTSTNYLVLFKSPRDSSQIEHLARQVYPRNKAFSGRPLRMPRATHTATW
jgi:GTPase SAR1 family protein